MLLSSLPAAARLVGLCALAGGTLPAVASPPPAAEFDLTRLDDTDAWQQHARALLDGPPGCIEVQGRVRVQVSLYSAGGFLSSGSRQDVVGEGRFTGRLDQGVWTALETTWTEQPSTDAIVLELDRFHPIVGRMPAVPKDPHAPRLAQGDVGPNGEVILVTEDDEDNGELSISKGEDGIRVHMSDGGQAALGMLDEILEDLKPNGTAVYVTWNEDTRTVELTESVPLDGEGVLAIDTHFPEGEVPTWLDARFPKRITLSEEGVRFTIRDAQLHLRSKATPLGVVPGVEGVSAVVGFMGFTIGLDQRVGYDRVRACPGG